MSAAAVPAAAGHAGSDRDMACAVTARSSPHACRPQARDDAPGGVDAHAGGLPSRAQSLAESPNHATLPRPGSSASAGQARIAHLGTNRRGVEARRPRHRPFRLKPLMLVIEATENYKNLWKSDAAARPCAAAGARPRRTAAPTWRPTACGASAEWPRGAMPSPAGAGRPPIADDRRLWIARA